MSFDGQEQASNKKADETLNKRFLRADNLSAWLTVGGAVFMEALPFFLHHKVGDEELPLDFITSSIAIMLLLLALWLEHNKSKNLLDNIHEKSRTTQEEMLRGFGEYSGTAKASAERADRLLGEAKEHNRQLLEVLGLSQKFASRSDDLKILFRLLDEPSDGMLRLRNRVIINLVRNHLDYFQLNLDRPNFERNRMSELGCAIQFAEKYAFACTYCDPSYLDAFWSGPGEKAIDAYCKAHADALEGDDEKVQRIFIMTEKLKNNAQYHKLYDKVLSRLLDTGMICLYEMDEEDAKTVLGETIDSFFVADDLFVSESFVVKSSMQPGQPRRTTGLIGFDPDRAKQLRSKFDRLRHSRYLGRPITKADLATPGPKRTPPAR